MSYADLYDAVKLKYANSKGAFQQEKTNEIWRKLKEKYPNKKDLITHTLESIRELQNEVTTRKASTTLFFTQVNITFIIIYFEKSSFKIQNYREKTL